MLIVNIDTFNRACSQVVDPVTRPEGLEILRRILDIKQSHLWRSEAIAPCCGSLGGFACQLGEETDLLEKAIDLIEQDKLASAEPLLDRLGLLISRGLGQQETPELIERLTAQPDKAES